MRICIVGTGYVGLVTGACFSYLGHEIVCVDRNVERIDQLSRGVVPFFEPGLAQLLTTCRDLGTLKFTTDLAEGMKAAEVVFITVGTPPLPTGGPDLRAVEEVARDIGAGLDSTLTCTVVIKSTVPIGAGLWISNQIREEFNARRCLPRSGDNGLSSKNDSSFWVVVNPEFMREGMAIHDALYPDRIVIGAEDDVPVNIMRSLYAPVMEQGFHEPPFAPRPSGFKQVPLVATDLQSAEMIKCSANAFLATKISFANEIALLCEKVGADIVEVARGIGLDARIGSRYLDAGIGWGGNRFDVGIGALISVAKEYGYEPHLLHASVAINHAQRQRVVQKLQEQLKVIKGRTIGILGLALKPNTDDLRDVPSLAVAEKLLKLGARIKVYDPVAMGACREQFPELMVSYALNPIDLATDVDALLVVTEWEEFRALRLSELAAVMRLPILIDARNIYHPEEAKAAGLTYVGIGR